MVSRHRLSHCTVRTMVSQWTGRFHVHKVAFRVTFRTCMSSAGDRLGPGGSADAGVRFLKGCPVPARVRPLGRRWSAVVALALGVGVMPFSNRKFWRRDQRPHPNSRRQSQQRQFRDDAAKTFHQNVLVLNARLVPDRPCLDALA